LDALNKKLANVNFISKAPKEVVERERQKKAQYEEKLEKLEANLASLD
ncbi:MAG: hypothetical protein GXO73_07725, partial [Calditrichaeota bacterium]|nr:hypothetical protein [Calditrichota bacterium]